MTEKNKSEDESKRKFLKYTAVGGVFGSLGAYSPKSEAFAFVASAKLYGELWGMAAKAPIDAGWDLIKEMWGSTQEFVSKQIEEFKGKIKEFSLNDDKKYDDLEVVAATQPSPQPCEMAKSGLETKDAKASQREMQPKFLKHNLETEVISMDSAINIGKGVSGITKSINGSEALSTEEKLDVANTFTIIQLSAVPSLTFDDPFKSLLAPSEAREIMGKASMTRCETAVISEGTIKTKKYANFVYSEKKWRNDINSRANPTGLLAESTRLVANQSQLLNQQLLNTEQQLVTKALLIAELCSQIKVALKKDV